MTNLSSTHRHDYRWHGENCVVPRAEIPSDHCDQRSEVYGNHNGGKELPWCGRNRPLPAQTPTPLPAVHVCNDIVATAENRPWCQRGLLVDQISPRKGTASVQPTLLPSKCSDQPLISTRKCCEGGDAFVPARVGAAPQQDTSRYDQPNLYLKKLCDKFPQPTAVVAATPREELTRRVYADRYRTTYQTDYCRNADDSARRVLGFDPYDVAKTSSSRISRSLDVPCKCGCQAHPPASTNTQVRQRACRPTAVSQNFHFSCCTVKKKTGQQSSNAEESGPPEKILPWASEYSNGIGRTAQIIMDQKLFYTKNKKQRLC